MLNAHRNKRDSFLNFINYVEEAGSGHELKDSPINWIATLDRASKLGVDSIIYHRMKQGGMLPRVPEEIVDRCKASFYWSQARNMQRFGRLKEVLRVFTFEQIPIIALKGAALAELVYPQMGLRPMADVDLLVHEEDLTKAEQLLVSLGFHANERNHSREWYRMHHHHLVPYVSRDRSLMIELHHRLIPLGAPIAISNDDLWERSRPVDITQESCRILSPEDFLIHLSLHLAVDSYIGKMRVLYDLAETIKHYQKEIDWDQLINIANGYRISKYLYYAFWLAKGTVRAGVPSPVLDILKFHFSGLPFEDQLVKAVIRKVVVIYEKNKHPVGYRPAYTLKYVEALLREKSGYSVEYIDQQITKLTIRDIEQKIQTSQPRVVAFDVTTLNMEASADLCKRLSEQKRFFVLLLGR